MSLITAGARPRLISSHSNSRGLDIRARPSATICCCPPDSEVDGLQFLRSLEDRERGCRRGSRVPRAAHLAPVIADHQVFLHIRKGRKQLPALWHQCDAARQDFRRPQAADRLARRTSIMSSLDTAVDLPVSAARKRGFARHRWHRRWRWSRPPPYARLPHTDACRVAMEIAVRSWVVSRLMTVVWRGRALRAASRHQTSIPR